MLMNIDTINEVEEKRPWLEMDTDSSLLLTASLECYKQKLVSSLNISASPENILLFLYIRFDISKLSPSVVDLLD